MDSSSLFDKDNADWAKYVHDDTRELPQPAVGMVLRSRHDVIKICELGQTVQGIGKNSGKVDRLVSYRVIEVVDPNDDSIMTEDDPAEWILWADLIGRLGLGVALYTIEE